MAMLASLFVVLSLFNAAPAYAASSTINGWRSQEPCGYPAVCVHYRQWAEGARILHTGAVPVYDIHRFSTHPGTRGSEGNRQGVRNNAASMNNVSIKTARMFYSGGYAGNVDVLGSGWAGNLVHTRNNNASFSLR